MSINLCLYLCVFMRVCTVTSDHLGGLKKIKMLHDDYLCLVESGKQQIKEVTGNSTEKLGNKGNS